VIAALAFVIACAGFTALALAMDRHHRVLYRRSPSPFARWALRALGCAGLAAALAVCVADAGWSEGSILWFGLLSAVALCIALVFAYAMPRSEGSAAAQHRSGAVDPPWMQGD
jgi:peptidoglycan/LPS O-acetylase OafA/YrhL